MSDRHPKTQKVESSSREGNPSAYDREVREDPEGYAETLEVQEKDSENNDTEEEPLHSNGGRPIGRILATMAAAGIGILLTSLDVNFSLDWLNTMKTAHPGDLTYPFIATAAIISNFGNLALNTRKIKTLAAEILGENLQTTAGRFGSSIILGLLHAGIVGAEAYTTWWYLNRNFGATPTWLLETSTIGLTVLDNIFFKFAIANWKDKSHKSILPAFSEATIQWLGPATLEALEVLSFLHILTHPELQEQAIRILKTGSIIGASLLGFWIGWKALVSFLENHGEEIGEVAGSLVSTPTQISAFIKRLVNNIKSGYGKTVKSKKEKQVTSSSEGSKDSQAKNKRGRELDLTVLARNRKNNKHTKVIISIPNNIVKQIPNGKVKDFASILSRLIRERNIPAEALKKPDIVSELAAQALQQLQQELQRDGQNSYI